MSFIALRARLHRRSFWQLRYIDGQVVDEMGCDWSSAPLPARQSVRLYCPDGKVAELGSADATGRLFQLKVGELAAGIGRRTVAHIIGLVDGPAGECQYAAWDYDQGTLVTGRDNVLAMQYQNIGKLAYEPMGLTPV